MCSPLKRVVEKFEENQARQKAYIQVWNLNYVFIFILHE